MALKKASVSLLLMVASAMFSDKGFHFATPGEADELVKAGLAEQNPEIAEGDHLATRLTETGRTEAVANGFVAPTLETPMTETVTAAPSSGFTIDTDIPVPSQRGGKGGEKYPFDNLPVNGSFFVPATAENDNPAKSLASTVSSATARYAVETGENETVTLKTYQVDGDGKRVKNAEGKYIPTGEKTETRPVMREVRKFTVRSVDETAQGRGKGARVWRTA